jgi:hypothetical protein
MQGAGGGRRGEGRDDILGRLGLRVPMPIFDSTVHQPVMPSSSSSGWGWNGLSPTMPTPMKQISVSSTMYMLGLGKGAPAWESRTGTRLVSPAAGWKKKKRRSP